MFKDNSADMCTEKFPIMGRWGPSVSFSMKVNKASSSEDMPGTAKPRIVEKYLVLITFYQESRKGCYHKQFIEVFCIDSITNNLVTCRQTFPAHFEIQLSSYSLRVL